MSGHHKNKGFSQTSKRFDGALKAQHQRSRNKQMDHSADHHEIESENRESQNVPSQKKSPRS
ncbi:hypothetical protein EZJ49_12130 [Bdellovibrio bacteriovorus]|uniref:hypothetical protein n=1 Tax=Bdellovibrio bacteriovorus TaxID=959 RepID=UPI0021CF9E9A|nr:hypothetical protein [Bdellovibrio bacteriovorus]UXR63810.1 hypothetical protein EZJ49_12130 [Bdellovibrio bacteriovorus]